MAHPEDFPSMTEGSLSEGGDNSFDLGFGVAPGRHAEILGGGEDEEEWEEDESGKESEEVDGFDEEEEV